MAGFTQANACYHALRCYIDRSLERIQVPIYAMYEACTYIAARRGRFLITNKSYILRRPAVTERK
jgi:hypothetical protein